MNSGEIDMKEHTWAAIVGIMDIPGHTNILQRISISADRNSVSLRVSGDAFLMVPLNPTCEHYDFRMYDYSVRRIDDKYPLIEVTAKINTDRLVLWEPEFADLERRKIHLNRSFDEFKKLFDKDVNNKYMINEMSDIQPPHPVIKLRAEAIGELENAFHSMLTNFTGNEIKLTIS
jgi:hypothetical protein